MLYGGETWPVNQENVIILETTDVRMVKWMCKDRISTEEDRTRLKLKSMRECLQDKRL